MVKFKSSSEIRNEFAQDTVKQVIGPEAYCRELAKTGCIERIPDLKSGHYSMWKIVRPITYKDAAEVYIYRFSWRHILSFWVKDFL